MPETPDDQRPPYRRRALLRQGQSEGWWAYESENPAGHRDAAGVEYSDTSYTVRMPSGQRVTLRADQVDELADMGAQLTAGTVAGVVARMTAEGPANP